MGGGGPAAAIWGIAPEGGGARAGSLRPARQARAAARPHARLESCKAGCITQMEGSVILLSSHCSTCSCFRTFERPAATCGGNILTE
jgi:hypothetical protein